MYRLLSRLLASLVLALAGAHGLGAAPQDEPAVSPQDLIVREVVFDGLETYDEEGVLRALGIEIGKPMPVMRPGVQRVWEVYRLLVLEPKVDVLPGGGLRLSLKVAEQPVDLDPRFVGNDDIPTEKLYEWAGLFDREEIYVYEADAIKNRLIEGYKRQGYHHVEVEVVVGSAEDDEVLSDLIFQVREGPRVRCTGIEVRNNSSLPDTGWGFWRGGLKSLAKLQTKGRGIFRWWGGVFDEEVLAADLLAMREVYRDRGWLNAKVEIDELEFNDARDRVKVWVIVDEGPLWRVSSLDVVAVDPEDPTGRATEPLLYSKEALLDLLELRPGRPFESARRLHDSREVSIYYGAKGHVAERDFRGEATNTFRWLEPDFVYDGETKEVAVTYRIVQGIPRTVREFKVTGNAHTNDPVIRRNVSLLPGDRVDMREIGESLRRIRSTGYFEDVQDPRHPPPTVIFHEVPGQPNLVDVEYVLEEGRVVDFSLSGGINSDRGLVGLISLNMRNFQSGDLPSGFWSSFGEVYRKEAFHGNGESFGVTLSPGTEVSYWSIDYSHPDLFGDHFDRYAGRVELLSRDRRYRSHDEDRTRGSLTIARLFDQGDFSVRVGPRWMEVDLNDLDEDETLPYTLLDSEGESTFQGLSLDLRLSKLDSRWSPRSGFFAEWNNTLYGGPFGGDNDIWVTELSWDKYFELGSEEADVRSSIYLGLSASVAHPFGDTEFVNYAERGFLGGSTRMKGFDFRGVGPTEGDFALGGETSLFGTLEYRYPAYSTPIPGTSRRQEVFRVSPFVDVGLLDPDSWSADLEELRVSAGLSFGLVQPIPLTFNFGFPLRDDDGDDLEVFSFRLSTR